jgi:hypothetical protein
MTRATFPWVEHVIPIMLSDMEAKLNRGPEARIKILDARLKSNLNQMKRLITRRLLGVGTSGQALVSFNGMTSAGAGGFATGFFGKTAFASQTQTVGGITRSSSIPGWCHQIADVSDDFSANGLDAMNSIYVATKSYGASDKFLWLGSTGGVKNYKASIQANERYVDGQALDAGRFDLAYNGAPVAIEPALTEEGASNSTADEEITFYALDLSHIKIAGVKDAFFDLSEWTTMPGVDAEGAYLRCMLTPAADHFASSGVIVDGNTI